ncbi:ABC transporter permease [Chryseolinea soli]|uniref:FtsX-like permease family protein n=1 Tax=Chryseolinea soli TaxID=2321403 RepID=A0A385SE77_9BACT|nr:ABC transporter permease [Chryseolinea soli]AYB29509.1 FtsX-like permease family protein [Chryseolinea soli]
MFTNFFKTTFRNLRNNKVYSFINIAGLTLGMACAMLILLYVNDEVSYDAFQKNTSVLYRINRQITRPNGDIDKSGYTGYLQGPRFAANIPEVQAFVRYQQGEMNIQKGIDIHAQEVFLADTNFFSVFSFPLIAGNVHTALQQPNSVVITEDMAKKEFGTTDAVGKLIMFKDGDNFSPYEVTAVAKNCPQNSSIQFDVIMPLKVSKEDAGKNENWFNSFLNTFVVLTPQADAKMTSEKMQHFFLSDAAETIKAIQQQYNIKDIGMSFYLQPFGAIHLSKDAMAETPLFNASNPVYSYILSGIAVFILLIACINFINLTVARSVKRAKEIGIRKVVGSSRRQLVIQFLGESFVFCLVAFTLSIVVVQLVLPVFNQLCHKSLSLAYLLDIKLVFGYVLLLVSTSLLAGVYSAVVLSGYQPAQTLYARFSLAGKGYLQKCLVVFQFALASFLIIATFAIFLQFDYLTTQPLGYDDENVVTVEKPGITRNEAALFRQSLLRHADIIDAAPKNSGYSGNTLKVNGDDPINTILQTVDTSYLPILKISIVQGRNFSSQFPSDSTKSVLVNESFVKQAGWKSPIGEQISNYDNNEKVTVIGVVKDYHFKPLTHAVEPELFTMSPQNNFGMMYIKIRPGSEAQSLAFIQQTFRQLFPLDAYAYHFLDRQNAAAYEAEARWKQIILFSATLTIFISCIGLFGLSVLSAEKRTKEIGIRKVLGASVSSIVSILSTDFLKLIVISLAISIPLAWLATHNWLQHYPYRITLSGWLFASAGFLVMLIGLLTVSFQSIKAAVANPVDSLKTE